MTLPTTSLNLLMEQTNLLCWEARGILADALEEEGREEEAKLLRSEVPVLRHCEGHFFHVVTRLHEVMHWIGQLLNDRWLNGSGENITVVLESHRVYWKIMSYHLMGFYNSSKRIYCFVRKADGAMLKACSLKKADTNPRRIRAYLTDTDCKIHSILDRHGLIYLR